jgi:hypothetical protein
MAQFTIGKDTEVKSPDTTLSIVMDPTNPLKVGKHVFQLVVVDDSGNPSAPATVTIVVLDKSLPTAVIEVINAQNQRISTPTVEIPFQQTFTLVGDKSTDVGGVVKMYVWTLLQ